MVPGLQEEGGRGGVKVKPGPERVPLLGGLALVQVHNSTIPNLQQQKSIPLLMYAYVILKGSP